MLVLDTNAIIYHLSGVSHVSDFLSGQLEQSKTIIVPTVVVAEFLSFPAVTESDSDQFNVFLSQMQVVPLELPIAQLAARIRREYKLHLADAVIAATALAFEASLVTRNVRDFKKVKSLRLVEV